ncbi:Uncharacterised protein [Vibrio alginolyticus]|nr:type VI secretion system amidase effector protein Tae4 [Vibrio alginolyticus]SUP19284.1 Uncharacterised protein [Vibrio alginolyticus]
MSLQVSSGQDKFWYIFRVKILIKYLSEKYFSPEELTPEEHLEKIKERKGIIMDGVMRQGMLTYGVGINAYTKGMHQSLTKFCSGSAHDQGYDFHTFTDVIIFKS